MCSSDLVNSSVWFLPSTYSNTIEQYATDAYVMNDAYPLSSCLSVLLAEIGGGVTFEATTAYSEFLYSTSDVGDLFVGRSRELYLTPKSNITAGEYQTPAQMAPVTLKTILDMLKNTYRLYWFIDASKRLRIEHVEYFRRGGSYTTDAAVGIDLTQMQNIRNGKSWAFAKNEYKFDKIEMPERYEFGWMDDVTLPFKGKPMNILSPYVEQGKVEEIDVAQFTTDIDYMLLNSGNVSQDGFVAMTAEAANAVFYGNLDTTQDEQETDIVPVARYVGGNDIYMRVGLTGNGTATVVWYIGGRRVVSQIVINIDNAQTTYALSAPEGVTGVAFLIDGTLLVGQVISITRQQDSMLETRFVSASIDGQTVRMQNGDLSFLKLQNPYWLYDMPAKTVEVNGTQMTVKGITRKKQQTVEIPTEAADPDPLKLVRTGLGDGTVKNMSLTLNSRMAKTTLVYDTDTLI